MKEVVIDAIRKLAVAGGTTTIEGLRLSIQSPNDPTNVTIEIGSAVIKVNDPSDKAKPKR